MKTVLISLLLFCSICSWAQEAEFEYIPCTLEDAKHQNDGETVEVILINDLENTSTVIYWMNARQQKREYARMETDDEFPINTYTNHFWVIEDELGCLGIIRAKTSGEISFSRFPKLEREEAEESGQDY